MALWHITDIFHWFLTVNRITLMLIQCKWENLKYFAIKLSLKHYLILIVMLSVFSHCLQKWLHKFKIDTCRICYDVSRALMWWSELKKKSRVHFVFTKKRISQVSFWVVYIRMMKLFRLYQQNIWPLSFSWRDVLLVLLHNILLVNNSLYTTIISSLCLVGKDLFQR